MLRTLDQPSRKHVGRKSKGWLSSSLRGTLQTADILAEQGCTFYCDIMNDDQPYLLRTPHGPIVSVPYSNEINDFTFITRKNYTTDQFRDALIEELDVLLCRRREDRPDHERRACTRTSRAARTASVRCASSSSMRKALPGVWWATREEIADWYLANHESHIPGQLR